MERKIFNFFVSSNQKKN